jgi:hypothetical protein
MSAPKSEAVLRREMLERREAKILRDEQNKQTKSATVRRA